MALFSIPKLGSESNYTEDIYSSGNNVGKVVMSGGDHPSYPQEVVLSCPNKNVRISASLGGQLQLSVTAEWEEMFGGGIGAIGGGIIGTANNVLQWTGGKTMQQPWMNRKIYKNTKPFSFTLPLNFVTPAGQDPMEWVAKPAVALISLAYPRIITDSGGKKWSADADELFKGDGSSVVSTALRMLTYYAIPGPALMYDSTAKDGEGNLKVSQDDRGDYVNVMIGNLFNLGACYLTNVSLTYSEAFNEFGFPLALKASVQITCADQVVCDKYGNFVVNIPPQNAAGLTEFLDAAGATKDNLKKNVSKLTKSVGSFFSGKD
jgi:hypothetical protein